MSRSRTLAALAGLALLASAFGLPSSAQTDVDVSLDNPGGSRALYVEDLLGQPVTSLDFGVSRAQPLRVRVVDTTMDRSAFTVSAEMTNLYLADGADLLYGTIIASSKVSITHPLVPLNIRDAAARVQPVFDLAATLTGTLCTAVQTAGGSCVVSAPDVDGVIQSLPVSVDLDDLTNLPLLPQGSDPGTFSEPSYEGVGAGDPAAAGSTAATARQMIKGSVVSTTTLLNALDTALAAAIAGKDADEVVDTGVLTSAVRDAIGGTVWDALSVDDQQLLLDALVVTAENVVATSILSQTGTYLSFPVLTVAVPTDAAKGTYRGTLVVTGLQP